MIPLLTADQLRAVDEATVRNGPIAEIDLMERAAARCTEWLLGRYPRNRPFHLLAGMGNNGGDGLAIARMLHGAGRTVRVTVLAHRDAGSTGYTVNRERAEAAGVPLEGTQDTLPGQGQEEVLIDALFGNGLDRPLTGGASRLVAAVNAQGPEVVSIDVPSGLFDSAEPDAVSIVRATHTLALELPRRTFLFAEYAPYVGRWHVLPIGLDRAAMAEQRTQAGIVEPGDLLEGTRGRMLFAHKGTFGHALLLAGGPGKVGAAVLAAEAAQASGVGRITLRIPTGNEGVVHARLPQVMIDADGTGPELTEMPRLEGYAAIGIGPGIGTGADTERLLKRLIQEFTGGWVLDADAINLLSANPTWLAFLPKGSILTPHPKEFDRLAGPSTSGRERCTKARELAVRNGLVVVLKGAFTAVCTPQGQVFFNPTGNPGMAKGGSGDALTGLITGLLAQGLGPVRAALLGVYLHGAAGDLAAMRHGQEAMTIPDLIAELPAAWKALRGV